VVADPALWLCHNCGKCTEMCPRGARPSDVLGALRRETIRHFAFPQFMGALVNNPKALPILFLLPALIFAAMALWAPTPVPAPAYEFGSVFPIAHLEALFFAVSGFALLSFVVSLTRYRRALRENAQSQGWPASLAEIAANSRLAVCDEPAMRVAHLLTFWGFMGLALVGTAAGIGTMTGLLHTPLALTHPVKIFANASALAALVGVTILLWGRPAPQRTYFDWFFLATLGGVLFTGILSELLRLMQAGTMYGIYFIHLVLVFALLLYSPYSKFAHLAYRSAAMAASPKLHRHS
jgi:quinone-modifying oxidoreductase subunit QmoC